MTIDPANFQAQGKPTLDQALAVYNAMSNQSAPALYNKLKGMGYDVALSSVARWIANKFLFKGKSPSTLKIKHNFNGVPSPANAHKTAESLVGNKLTPEEVNLIEQDMTELKALEVPQLKAMMEKERLIYNIMLMRFSQRSADRLAMAPQASAALVKAMSEAEVSIPHIPTGLLPDSKWIDVTPNEQNEVSSAIDLFLKQEGVAA